MLHSAKSSLDDCATAGTFRGFCACAGCRGFNLHFCGVENHCSCSTVKLAQECFPKSEPEFNNSGLLNETNLSCDIPTNEPEENNRASSSSRLAISDDALDSSTEMKFFSLAESKLCALGSKNSSESENSRKRKRRNRLHSTRPWSSLEEQENREYQLKKFSDGKRSKSLPSISELHSQSSFSCSHFQFTEIQSSEENCSSNDNTSEDSECCELHFFSTSEFLWSVRTPLRDYYGRGITVSPNGNNLYVCHLTRMFSYQKEGEVSRQFDIDPRAGCWGIAVNYRGNCIITDSKRGMIYITDKNFRIIKKISGCQSLRHLCRIERTNEGTKWKQNTNFDERNKRVSDQQDNHFCVKEKAAGLLGMTYHIEMVEPRYVAVNNQNQILVTDTALKRLIAINADSSIAFSISVGAKTCEDCERKDKLAFKFAASCKRNRSSKSQSEEATGTRYRTKSSLYPSTSSACDPLKPLLVNSPHQKRKSCVEKLFSGFFLPFKNKPTYTTDLQSFSEKDDNRSVTFCSKVELVKTNDRIFKEKHSPNLIDWPVDNRQDSHDTSSQNRWNSMSSPSTGSRLRHSLHVNRQLSSTPLSTSRNSVCSPAAHQQGQESPPCSTIRKSCMRCCSGDPRGVCVDEKDNILVADKANNSVLLYNSDGVLQRTLLCQLDDIREPRQIKAIDYKTLAVIDANNTIKLFVFEIRNCTLP